MREIIAEIGQNHNGDMALAKELIHAAKKNGADVAKFQLFDTSALFTKEGYEWYDYNCSTELSKNQVLDLSNECNKIGIEFGASVFDCERVDWLEEINISRYKIASRSINDIVLIDRLASINKPLIVSLGMWKKNGFPQIDTQASVYFLYCISKYPTDHTDLHLSGVDFSRYDGFSDHTIGISAATCAFSRGARIVEKHFTLNKNAYGPDHAMSMTPDELRQLNQFRNELDQML
mgnify:CR=1 FL=1